MVSFSFPHDPGNNRWKSQLLRVLSKRSLCPDKAAQVLLAKGTTCSACNPGTYLTMLRVERLPPWDAGSHWLVFGLESSWRILVIVDGTEPECCVPFSVSCQTWVWFPITQACALVLGFCQEWERKEHWLWNWSLQRVPLSIVVLLTTRR